MGSFDASIASRPESQNGQKCLFVAKNSFFKNRAQTDENWQGNESNVICRKASTFLPESNLAPLTSAHAEKRFVKKETSKSIRQEKR